MSVKLIQITADCENTIVHCARVSNPASQAAGLNNERLLKYLIRNKHWSPFEMANATFEIKTTRDISRQILRHRSFHFQEFSQRYAEAKDFHYREARMQHPTNRQLSVECEDDELNKIFMEFQQRAVSVCSRLYEQAIGMGIAKEQARVLLPEGLTETTMYMSGTIRDWIHYLRVRTGEDTQKEHRQVAQAVEAILAEHLPTIAGLIKED